jgi:hypothetical protein
VRTKDWVFVVCLGGVVFLGSVAGNGAALGSEPYNPYAPVEALAPPVAADGKLNWPTFYKSAATRQRFQSYFAIGACAGTNKEINARLLNNRVDIDKLGEKTVSGRVVRRLAGIVTIVDPTGSKIDLVTHPAGVSKVSVSGTMPVDRLRAGMTVRFVGQVDDRGIGSAPLQSLTVVDPTADFRWPAVEVGRESGLAARVVRLTGDHLQVLVPTGKLRRLTFEVGDATQVTVASESLSLAAAGDNVEAKGHVYSGPGAPSGNPIVFASEITVTKEAPIKQTPSARVAVTGNSRP